MWFWWRLEGIKSRGLSPCLEVGPEKCSGEERWAAEVAEVGGADAAGEQKTELLRSGIAAHRVHGARA